MAFDLPLYVPSDSPPPDLPPPQAGAPLSQRSIAPIAGFKSGGYGLVGAGAGFLSGVAKAVGADQASDYLGQKATQFNDDASQVGRPDLDNQGFFDHGVGGFLSKAGYTLGQAIPGIAAAGVAAAAAPAALGLGVGGAAAAALEGGEAVGGVAGLASRVGSILPKFLGGGEGVAGARTAAAIGGAAIPQAIQSGGELVNTAAEQPGGLTQGNAIKALALGVPVGLAQSIVPAEGAILAKGGEGLLGQLGGRLGSGTLANFTEHAITNAAAGAVGSGLQKAADLSFDPNASPSDKAQQIVQAAAGGALSGGLIGGTLGTLFGRGHGPQDIQNAVDAGLSDAGISDGGAPPAGPAPTPVQQELPLQARPEAVAGPNDLQLNLFGEGPYNPGPLAPVRTQAQARAEVEAARKANIPTPTETPAAATPATLRDALQQPDAPPPNAFAKEAVQTVGIAREARAKGELKDFVSNSTATNPAELYNEILAVDPQSKLAESPGFIKLADKLGVGNPDLEGDLARAQADPAQTDKVPIIQYQLGLRDAAARLRESPAEATPASAGTARPAPIEARQVPADINVPDIPETTRLDDATSPAVPTDGDAKGAAQRASTAIQTLGPDITASRLSLLSEAPAVERTPAAASPDPAAGVTPDTGPKSIADKVLDAARSAVGDKGGEVDIASIRAALPDIAPKDIDNALRDIHADDTDHTLVQNPKGQRTGVDGVSVPGSGRFHKLDVAPREDTTDAVQVGSAAPEALGDQPEGGGGVRGGDTTRQAPAGESGQAQTEAGQKGAAEPAGQGAASSADVTPEQAREWANLRPQTDADFAAELKRPPVDGPVYGIKETSPNVYRLTQDGKVFGDQPGRSRDAAIAAAQAQAAKPDFDITTRRPMINRLDPEIAPQVKSAAAPATSSVIRDKATGRPVMETSDPKKLAALNTAKYEAVPVLQHLQEVNDPTSLAGKAAREGTPQQVAKDVATSVKLAPQDPAAKSSAQAAQDAAKTRAVGNMLAAGTGAKEVGKPVVTKLRRQTRAKTALIETPDGDALPTEAIGGQMADLAQATATLVDPIQPAGPAEPMAKTPFDRVPGIADNAPAVPREQVDAHVAKFVAKLRPEVQGNIHVIDNEAGLPQVVRDAAAATGHDLSTTPALFYKGEVFLRADQMRNLGEVEDALSHEVFGHLATAKRYENATDYQNAMSGIFERIGGLPAIEKIARSLGVYSEHEDGKNLQGGAGLKEYMPADRVNVSPLQKTRILDELIAHRAAITPTPIDNAIAQIQDLARKGIVNTLRRAGLHTFAKRLDTFTQADLSKWVADSRAALRQQPKPGDIDLAAGASDPRLFLHDSEPTGEPPFLAKISGSQRDSQGVMGAVGSILDHLNKTRVMKDLFGEKLYERGEKGPTLKESGRAFVRAFLENTAPANELAEEGKVRGMSGLKDHYEIQAGKQTDMETRLKGVGVTTTQDHFDLGVADKARKTLLDKVMAVSTQNDLDPRIAFDQHSWLSQTNSPERVEELKAVHAQLAKDYQALGQPMQGGKPSPAQRIFNEHLALNNFHFYMSTAQALHTDLVQIHGLKPAYNPSERFAGLDHSYVDKTGRPLAEDLHNDVNAARAFAKKAYDDMMAEATAHLTNNGTRPENVGTRPFNDLGTTLRDNQLAEQQKVNQGPYFPLRRDGEFTSSGRIKGVLDENGNMTAKADPAALKAVSDYMAKNFPQVSFGASDANRNFFARFPSEEVANNFHNLFQEGGPLRQHVEDGSTRVAKISDSNTLDGVVPALQEHIDQAAALFDRDLVRMPDGPNKTALEAERAKYIGNLRASLIQLRGDNSMPAIQSRRENVQGANADMAENQSANRAAYARDIAFTSVRNEKAEALAQARQAIADASRAQGQDAAPKAIGMQRLYDAYQARNAAADIRVGSTLLGRIKAGMHAYTLGASPAYVIMNLSQLGTLGVPEFAKFHGFGRSVTSMVKASVPASRIIAAMYKTGGVTQGGITKAVLDAARLSAEDRNYLSDVVNHGHLELGSFSANESGVSFGNLGRVGRFLHYANGTALMAETYSRVIMALAAKDLHDNIPAGKAADSMRRQFPTPLDYAGHVIPETMMRWGSTNTPKFMTAGGPLGKAGPVVTQFHGWVPRIVGKLYREAANGYLGRIKGEGPEADQMRAEARAFTMAHIGAVVAMSGGLGLPFAGYAAGAATRLSGTMLDQPYDVEAGIRGFMAEVFGKDLGEVLSRGLPRYLGADLSDLGDDNFAPLARLVEDRRKLEDAVPDYLAHAWGSAPSAALNMMLGAREMSEGRWSEAGARALPTSLRNLARAYRVNEMGYTTSTGEKLPIDAGAGEVLKTALGVQGGQMAEYREKQDAVQGLRDDRSFRSGLIKRDFRLAAARGDQAGMQAAVDAARKYGQDNPGENLVQQLPSLIPAQKRDEALARVTGAIGVNPKDMVARNVINY